jgi:hypothetical protein
MQAANLVISCGLPATENARPVLPFAPLLFVPAPELGAAPPELDPLAAARGVVVVVPRLATAGACDAPQPVAAIPMAARIATRNSFTGIHETTGL